MALFLFSSLALASDLTFWDKIYGMATAPEYPVVMNFNFEKNLAPIFSLELAKEYDPNFPLHIEKIEFDGINVKSRASMLKKQEGIQELLQVYYRPFKPLKPGFHMLLVQGGISFEKKIIAHILKIDPEMNVFEPTQRKEMVELFGRLQEQRAKTRTLDCNFTLSITNRLRKAAVEQNAEGRLEITGEDKIDYTLASAPEVKGPGIRKSFDFISREKKGSRLLLWPLHLANYIPYED